jgi:putative ABC transport system permease protein
MRGGLTAARMLARDWRGGELGVLIAALVLAVAVVAGISAFTTRLQSALEQESRRFLAADRVVASSREMPREWLAEARQLGLATAETLTFPSMVYAGEDGMVLGSIKAVTSTYPLRGELTFSAAPFGEPLPADGGPAPGEVWLDSRLFPLLDVQIGDRVGIGEAEFTVAAAARTEPDRAASFFGLGPRVLMHMDDIPATQVVQPGSRVRYRQLYAGEEETLQAFVAALKPRLGGGERILDIQDGQPGVGRALERAESFLLLAGSLGVVLAGVAIALAARRFSERHTDYVAIMKSLGATSSRIAALYGGSLIVLGVTATVAGCLFGWGLQAGFFRAFADQLPVTPGASGLTPYWIGAATAAVCLGCFAWPPLQRLSRSSPLRVLRRDMPDEQRRSLFDYLLGLAAVAVLMLWYSGDLRLAGAVLAGLALTAALGMVLALTLLRGGRLVGMRAGSIWRLALAGLQRRGGANALQVVIFAMAMMLLLVLTLIRTSLIDNWQAQIPPETPNHFMLNISPSQVSEVEQLLRAEGVDTEALYPMIRGRIMAVNDEPLPQGDGEQEGPRQREANFTWSDDIPPGNELIAGEWWAQDTEQPLVSLEVEFAERMGVSVGDRVSLLIGSQPLEVTVSNLRELDWQSFRPNFFMVFPPQVLRDYPATFMTSFHLGPEEKLFLNTFLREFPTVTVIEMDVVVEQLQMIVEQVSSAIELVLVVIIAAGALVLVAGVQASVDARMHESAVLRALGARRGLLLGGLTIEFATLGLFAGLLATLAAELSVWALQTWVMDIVYRPTPSVWPFGILLATVLIAALGVLSCRRVVSSPPIRLLREL